MEQLQELFRAEAEFQIQEQRRQARGDKRTAAPAPEVADSTSELLMRAAAEGFDVPEMPAS